MIYVEKSQPAPACLTVEKQKANGDYKCGDVLSRTRDDFRNKCYICEYKAPSTINVEHFKSHQGNKDLKFDWNNLFYACGHCNNIKGHHYDDILNCTDKNDLVDEWIRYDIKPFPGEKAKIEALKNTIKVKKTVELLQKAYNGHTTLKAIEAANIRQVLIEEVRDFGNNLDIYFKNGYPQDYKEAMKKEIQRQLSPYSPFTAFKKWIVRENGVLMQEFGDLLTGL